VELLAEIEFPEARTHRGGAEILVARYHSSLIHNPQDTAWRLLRAFATGLAEQGARPLMIKIWGDREEQVALVAAHGSPIAWVPLVWGIIGIAGLAGLIYLAHKVEKIEWLPELFRGAAGVAKWTSIGLGILLLWTVLERWWRR